MPIGIPLIFEIISVLCAREPERVPLVPRQQRRAEAAGEDCVAARGLVDDGDVCEVGFLQAREEKVRSPVVGVVGAARARR